MNNNLRHSIMPNHATLESWLGTRKSARGKHVGIFQTENFSKDNNMFWIAIFGEVFGALLLFYGLWSQGMTDSYFTGGISIAVLLGVFLDYLLALYLHRNVRRFKYITIFKEITSNYSNSEAVNAEIYRLNKFVTKPSHTILDILSKTFLYLVGVFKAVVFYELFQTQVQNFVVIVIVAIGYLLIAFIHIKHTGYRHAEITFQKNYRKCEENWSKETGNDGSSLTYRIKSFEKHGDSAFSQKIFECKNADIKNIDLGSVKLEPLNESTYVIKFLGLVYDDEIDQMRNHQTNKKAKDLIDLATMELQFDLLPKLI